jgi:hypothetical protein
MNALPSFGRNDLIRATALVAVLAFPLFAYAGLGGSAVSQPSKNAPAATVAAEPATATTASATPCAEQHWPFFSQDCLRGSTQQPRLVSLTSDTPAQVAAATPVAAAPATKPAQVAEVASSKAVKPKKQLKPHVASRSPERRSPPVTYAAAPAPAPAPAPPVLMAGW